MSSEDRWHQINMPPEPVEVDADQCCSAVDAETHGPLDDLIADAGHLLLLGGPEELTKSPALGRLILLGVVSATETFFKRILAGAVRVCPICRDHAGSRQISFAAIEQYGNDHLELGLVEGVAFSTKGELMKTLPKVTGFKNLDNDQSFRVALDNFETVCQLRHACVHARGELSTVNLKALGLAPITGRRRVTLSLNQLHQSAKACLTVAQALNRILFVRIVERWIDSPKLEGRWESDKVLYSPLFSLFHSVECSGGPSNAYHSYRSVLPTLRKRISQS